MNIDSLTLYQDAVNDQGGRFSPLTRGCRNQNCGGDPSPPQARWT